METRDDNSTSFLYLFRDKKLTQYQTYLIIICILSSGRAVPHLEPLVSYTFLTPLHPWWWWGALGGPPDPGLVTPGPGGMLKNPPFMIWRQRALTCRAALPTTIGMSLRRSHTHTHTTHTQDTHTLSLSLSLTHTLAQHSHGDMRPARPSHGKWSHFSTLYLPSEL